jgi:hypothetical protein
VGGGGSARHFISRREGGSKSMFLLEDAQKMPTRSDKDRMRVKALW